VVAISYKKVIEKKTHSCLPSTIINISSIPTPRTKNGNVPTKPKNVLPVSRTNPNPELIPNMQQKTPTKPIKVKTY